MENEDIQLASEAIKHKSDGKPDEAGAICLQLFRLKRELVFGIIHKVLLSNGLHGRMDPEEIAEELPLHLYLKIDKYDPTRKFNSWFGKVVENYAKSRTRKKMEMLVEDINSLAEALTPKYNKTEKSLSDEMLVEQIANHFEAIGKQQLYDVYALSAKFGCTWRQIAMEYRLIDEFSDDISAEQAKNKVKDWLRQAKEIASAYLLKQHGINVDDIKG